MVGKGSSCQACGAPVRKDYEYCNVCGKRTSAFGGQRTGVVNPPRVLPAQGSRRKERPKNTENAVPRRELVIALLAMTCMAPFCTWLSSLGGLIGICAAFNEAFYGRYVVLLAALGLLTLMADDLLPAGIPRKAIVAAIGIGTVALTALDYAEIMKYNTGTYLIEAEPGIGMYLAFALGIALILTALVPKRKRAPYAAGRPVLRPGSRGSDP